MSDAFMGRIQMMAFNFAPKFWAQCNGQLLPINQNQALFSLLGTNFGGNGTTTFGLPNLNRRMAMGPGQGPGLTPRNVGDTGGATTVTLITAQMPAHTHRQMSAASPTITSPVGAVPAPTGNGGKVYRIPGAQVAAASGAIAAAGSTQPHENRQPYQAVNFCIALPGIFPPRP